MRAPVATIVLLLGGCDCSGAREPDAGPPDAEVDAGRDAGDAGGALPDAGDPDPLLCGRVTCSAAGPYCCSDSLSELFHGSCMGRPSIPPEDPGNQVDCWEFPLEPGTRPAEDCDGANPCPAVRPWCCTGVAGRSYCSVDALYGWGCVDLAGVPAGPTGLEREELIRRCADAEPCPADNPYCCDNLFCSSEPLYGWSCAIR